MCLMPSAFAIDTAMTRPRALNEPVGRRPSSFTMSSPPPSLRASLGNGTSNYTNFTGAIVISAGTLTTGSVSTNPLGATTAELEAAIGTRGRRQIGIFQSAEAGEADFRARNWNVEAVHNDAGDRQPGL